MNKKFFLSVASFSFYILVLTGCMSFGRHFPSQTDWIIKEQTSQQDVLMVLGRPYAVGNSDGTLVWTYLFYDYKIWQPTYQKELKIYWNSSKLVRHYQFNSSFPRDLKKDSALAQPIVARDQIQR